MTGTKYALLDLCSIIVIFNFVVGSDTLPQVEQLSEKQPGDLSVPAQTAK